MKQQANIAQVHTQKKTKQNITKQNKDLQSETRKLPV